MRGPREGLFIILIPLLGRLPEGNERMAQLAGGGLLACTLCLVLAAGMIPDFRLGWLSPCIASALGIVSGIAIGKLTEYYTATEYKPVRKLAKSATEGAAFVITRGDE